MAEIILAKCKGNLVKVLVDAEDFAEMSKMRWRVNPIRGGGVYTAGRSSAGKTVTIYLPRLLMNAQPGEYVDHINGNNCDNRKENLRITTNQENCQNRQGAYSNNTTGFRGVHYHKKYRKFEAYYWMHYKKYLVGYFESAEEASAAVTLARRANMPFSEMDKEGAVLAKTYAQNEENHPYKLAA